MSYPADRWLDNGWFVQFTETIPMPEPELPVDEEDIYDHPLNAFVGLPMFVHWCMVTDGTRAGIPNVSPAAMVASGFSGILYHFTIAEDQVRLIRDAAMPMVWADIAPGVPHTYRLELYGADSYCFYIDGILIDTGIPEGAYPTSDSKLVFGARAPGEPATTQWDYIRFGVIPQDGSGDFDSNSVVDAGDSYFFLDCLLGPDAAGPGCRWADMNGDGVANGDDAQLFALAMLGK